MATVYKTFLNNDIKSTRTLLHEAIPLTGTISSGTYGGDTVALGSETNIKNYSHAMFQSVFDYPYLSSSANHIFDLTVGYSTASVFSGSTSTQNAKKINIYNQMASVLMGYDATGSIERFDEDGDLAAGGTKNQESVFINFSRLLQKDEIKKGSFNLQLGASASYVSGADGQTFHDLITITDTNAQNNYRTNSSAGDYAILKATGSAVGDGTKVGLLFYQAGVAVITGAVFQDYGTNLSSPQLVVGGGSASMQMSGGALITEVGRYNDFNSFMTGASIQATCDALRYRIYNMSFNNTTELNSTIHFCRVNSGDYNYSSNPTYLSASKLRVKNSQLDAPVSYFTTVGLYSADNELLAVAKVSEPLKKDPTNEMTLRVRLDY